MARFVRGQIPNPNGRPKGSKNKVKVEVQEFARQLLEAPDYQESLRQRLLEGKAPHLETLLFHYAYGKPSEIKEDGNNAPSSITIILRDKPALPDPSAGPTITIK
jgi:hypothetical protein